VIVDVERVTTSHSLVDPIGGLNVVNVRNQDAERLGDTELAEFFRRAQAASRKGGEQGKELLGRRLAA
jgi:hypothetical protein